MSRALAPTCRLLPPCSGPMMPLDLTRSRAWCGARCCPSCTQSRQPTVYMAVPTMYSYLLSHFQQHMSPEQQADARAAAHGLRLAVSGSAAAPLPLLQQWRELAGQQLLERYGMTETGMVLSNPYEVRRAGTSCSISGTSSSRRPCHMCRWLFLL